jgi:hypothetical protein
VTLNENPVVESWNVDAEIYLDDEESDMPVTKKRSTPDAGHPNSASEEYDMDWAHELNTTAFELQKRAEPTSNSVFKLQSNSPGHLQWLSQLSRYTGLFGSYFNFDDLIYNEPTNAGSPIIYVIDSGFLNTHTVCSTIHHQPQPRVKKQ